LTLFVVPVVYMLIGRDYSLIKHEEELADHPQPAE
jgi:hypothetical protein